MLVERSIGSGLSVREGIELGGVDSVKSGYKRRGGVEDIDDDEEEDDEEEEEATECASPIGCG